MVIIRWYTTGTLTYFEKQTYVIFRLQVFFVCQFMPRIKFVFFFSNDNIEDDMDRSFSKITRSSKINRLK